MPCRCHFKDKKKQIHVSSTEIKDINLETQFDFEKKNSY